MLVFDRVEQTTHIAESNKEKATTNNNCDDVFKMLETEGLIGSEISYNKSIDVDPAPMRSSQHPSHSFKSPTFGSDEIFDQFYLENVSPLSEKGPIQYNDNSDDLNSVEMVQEMLSLNDRCYSSYSYTFSPYAPYTSSYSPRVEETSYQSSSCSQQVDFSRLSVVEILNLSLSIPLLISNNLMPRLITHHEGSRFLQNLLKEEDSDIISLVLSDLISNHDLSRLSEDRYGNYSMQILFEKGNTAHHSQLLSAFMYCHVYRLSRSEYGCRVIQKALRCISSLDLIKKLVSHLEDQAICDNKLHECLLDSNANHVIQAILNLELPFENVKFIKIGLESSLCFYSEHAFACRIVQCFIKKYGDKLSVNKLFESDSHLSLCQSMYGNYVIQCIIQPNTWYSHTKGISKFRWKLITELFCPANILFLSKNKYGSNVMESCIRVSTEKQVSGLIQILCNRDLFIIREMIKHHFGNYVIKTLLNNSNNKQQLQLIQTIETQSESENVYTEILFHEVQRIRIAHQVRRRQSNYYY